MSTFHLEIITPDRIAYQEDVNMVTVPGASGYMGILPHHVPLFSRLTHGEVKIVKGDEEIFLAIGGGFVEVTKEKVIVLVTKAAHADELNEQEILRAKEKAEEILREKPSREAIEYATQMLRGSLVDLEVLRRRKRKTAMHA